MKIFIAVLVVAVCAYFAWDNYSNRMSATPYYSELRVKFGDTGIELVGIGRMNSEDDCQRRTDKTWRGVLTVEGKSEFVSTVRCTGDIPARFAGLFDNRPMAATYIAMDRGNKGERDGRFIIYGVPASEVVRVCPQFIEAFKRRYSGKVECIQGTVG